MCSYIKYFIHFKLVNSSIRGYSRECQTSFGSKKENKNRRQSPSLSVGGTASIPPPASLAPRSFQEVTMPWALKNSFHSSCGHISLTLRYFFLLANRGERVDHFACCIVHLTEHLRHCPRRPSLPYFRPHVEPPVEGRLFPSGSSYPWTFRVASDSFGNFSQSTIKTLPCMTCWTNRKVPCRWTAKEARVGAWVVPVTVSVALQGRCVGVCSRQGPLGMPVCLPPRARSRIWTFESVTTWGVKHGVSLCIQFAFFPSKMKASIFFFIWFSAICIFFPLTFCSFFSLLFHQVNGFLFYWWANRAL